MLKRSLLALATLAVVAVPATASADPSVTTDAPCYPAPYVGGDLAHVGFAVAGFPADTSLQVVGGPEGTSDLGSVTADGAGAFAGQLPIDGLGDAPRVTFPLRVDTSPDRLVTASTSYVVTEHLVTVSPATSNPKRKVAFRIFGFVGGGTIYAHYAFTKSDTKHPLVKTVRLGRLTGPCGDLTTKKVKQLPLAHPKKGVYEIQFDTSPTFKRQKGMYVTRTVYVPR